MKDENKRWKGEICFILPPSSFCLMLLPSRSARSPSPSPSPRRRAAGSAGAGRRLLPRDAERADLLLAVADLALQLLCQRVVAAFERLVDLHKRVAERVRRREDRAARADCQTRIDDARAAGEHG